MSLEAFEKLPEEKKARIISAGIGEFSRRSFQEAGTEAVARACQISKGLLFHYFGSKKEFYLFCLAKALDRLTGSTPAPEGDNFYDILFAAMRRKLDICMRYPDETHMVNMASRDASAEIAGAKAELMGRYTSAVRAESAQILERALSALPLREPQRAALAAEGLQIYVGALMNNVLLAYQNTPDRFFADSGRIREELKSRLDLMLYGIAEKETP